MQARKGNRDRSAPGRVVRTKENNAVVQSLYFLRPDVNMRKRDMKMKIAPGLQDMNTILSPYRLASSLARTIFPYSINAYRTWLNRHQ